MTAPPLGGFLKKCIRVFPKGKTLFDFRPPTEAPRGLCSVCFGEAGRSPALPLADICLSSRLARFLSSQVGSKPKAKKPMVILSRKYIRVFPKGKTLMHFFKIRIFKLLAQPMRKLEAGAPQTPPQEERCRVSPLPTEAPPSRVLG